MVAAQSLDSWTAAKNSHLEVYSQTGIETALQELAWFEQLRAFFQQNGLPGAVFNDQGRPALRVICLRAKDYEKYRLRPIADAYYATDGTRDYIVMAEPRLSESGVAAHEYAHYVLHLSGLTLPATLSEGLAEFFSTLRPTKNGYEVGGNLPARAQTLRRGKWLAMSELFYFTSPSLMPGTREDAAMFYAESWALVDMLLTSPPYAAHFRELVSEFSAGSNPQKAFAKAYGESLDSLATDLKKWSRRPRPARLVPSVPLQITSVDSAALSQPQAKALLADVSLVSGHLEQARIQYEELLRATPHDPDCRGALGAIALRQGNREEALKQWRRAIDDNSKDAELCYRYALLAEEVGLSAQEIKRGLERAVMLTPGFDDARFQLALLENQGGDYRLAVEQLRAMRVPPGARRYHLLDCAGLIVDRTG